MKTFFSVLGKLLLLLAIVAAFMFALIIPIEIASGGTGGGQSDGVVEQIEGLVQIAAFVFGAWIMFWLFERRKGWALGWKQSSMIRQYAKGMLLGIVAITISFAGIAAAGGVHVEGFSLDGAVIIGMLKWFVLFVLVALNEELFCRGYLQGLIGHHYGAKTAIIVTSVLFALLHSANPGMWNSPFPIVSLALAGVFLGLCREVSGGLWLPMGVHLTWNFFQGNVYGFLVSGENVHPLTKLRFDGPDWLSGGEFGAEGSAVTIAVLLVCSVWVYRKRSLLRASVRSLETTEYPGSITN